MEKELDLILQEFDEGNMTLDTLKGKLLLLFDVSGRSEQLKALFDKHYEETGYISMTLEDSERYLKSL